MQLTKRHSQRETGSLRAFKVEDELWRVNWRQHGYPFCGVYAVSPDNMWPTKIGISTCPAKRLVELQCSSWRRLDIAEYFYCNDSSKARLIEAKSHAILNEDGKLLHGEWFDVRPDKAAEVIQFAGASLGIELHRNIPDERIRHAILQLCANLDQQDHITSGENLSKMFSQDSMGHED